MELVFFDLETTIPPTDIIEFGAIILDKDGLYEKESYSTLIWSDKVDDRSIKCNGITQEMLKDAPKFAEVADAIYNVLNGRIWAGHCINRFDIPHINKAFKKIGRPAPTPVSTIDTCLLLQGTFGKRAGDLKLDSLGSYFGLGKERHRSLEDIKMNIEILKSCSTIMFLEQHAGYSIGTCQSSNNDPEATVATGMQALRDGRFEDWAKTIHPDETKKFRVVMSEIIVIAKDVGAERDLLKYFQGAKGIEEVRLYDDQKMFASFFQSILNMQGLSAVDIDVLGHVLENKDTAHVVVRGTVSRVINVASLKRTETGWGMLMQEDMKDAALSMKNAFSKMKK
jgi:hypothetical protein